MEFDITKLVENKVNYYSGFWCFIQVFGGIIWVFGGIIWVYELY